MTDDLYSRDAYLATCDATVVGVTAEGVVLDRTVFYPRGGGQAGDTGTIRWDGGGCRVIDTFRSRDTGELIHAVDGSPPQPGAAVSAQIDWERRHRLMRTHTALHSLS